MEIALLLLVVAVVLALPVPQEVQKGVIPVLQRTEVRDEVGQFSISYLSGDGTAVSEQGALKPNADGSDNVLVQQGSFSYTSPEGNPIRVTYVADELGFRPEGSHLPVAPEVAPPTF
ncbi:endocuticle structural glycoprotein SgAbd-8-like [Cryptotermes secundus]|uniref:endocuticle structural glycoprotein SgAbd-8-like n=1 Tax=Cryptotermes secundus TaxID=105785 RepID=UPI000CD7C942|nr:endocuticle structural glycoprotein SgAbd-8-like [Cryptotermes secundus]